MQSELKKALLSTVALVLCTVCCVAVIVYPDRDREGKNRRDLAGTLELLVSGASQGNSAFDIGMMNELLSVKCYNLSENAINMRARYFVLDKELKRNPVKTVVIEVSSDALSRMGKGFEINRATLACLDTFSEKLEFLRLEEIPLREITLHDEALRIFSQSLEYGLQCWATILRKGQYDSRAEAEIRWRERQYYLAGSYEVPLSKEDFAAIYQADRRSAFPFREDNCDYLKKCIERAKKEEGVRVILCKLPESEASTLSLDNSEDLDAYMRALADLYQCEYYNFDLIRDRADLFPERYAFFNEGHLSRSGAETFTKLFCEVIGSDLPEEYFWDTYGEAALHGSYAEWVKEIEAEKGGASGAEKTAQEG